MAGVSTDLPVAGDRIELVEMGLEHDGRQDPAPMEAGSKGTVRGVTKLWLDRDGNQQHQIAVEWDPEVGRSLALVVPPDRYRIIERVMD